MYHNGQGVQQDYSKALEYYIKAANQGNLEGLNNAGNISSGITGFATQTC